MGLDDRGGYAQHHRASHFLHVQHLLHLGQVALYNGGGQLVLGALIEHFLQLAHHELYHALGGLQHQVSRKAVGDYHVHIPGKNAAGYKNPYPAGSYAHFVAQKKYPKTLEVYSNDELLKTLTRDNSKIIICIPQQRARLYIGDRVALDWPVSTGTKGHETPTGVFRVMEKDKDHKSNRYGRFINSRGRTSNSNADLSKGLPDGHSFRPASMPNWLRLTPDGVGIHGGRVVAGRRLSHGCIRTPYAVAAKLYEHAVVGMPVYVSRAIEDYSRGGYLKPIDIKYRPEPGSDYTDMPVNPTTVKSPS